MATATATACIAACSSHYHNCRGRRLAIDQRIRPQIIGMALSHLSGGNLPFEGLDSKRRAGSAGSTRISAVIAITWNSAPGQARNDGIYGIFSPDQ